MQNKTYQMVYTGIFAVLLAVCSWISIPTMIPFTLQTFGVFFTLLMLGGKQGAIAVLIYLLLGAAGIPVFSNFGAGLGYLFGNTGGYVLGFLCIALILWAFEKLFGRRPVVFIIAMLLGLIACYAFGTIWFWSISLNSGGTYGFMTVLGMCVFPFIIPDLCKMWLAYIISKRLRPLLHFQI